MLDISHGRQMKLAAEESELDPNRDVEKSLDFRDNIIKAYDNDEFKKHMRMDRATFHRLMIRLAPYLPEPYHGIGENIIPPEERLYIVLWFLATSESYRQLACRFGTTESVVHESVDMVLNAISEELASEVQFPSTLEEFDKIANTFQERNGFPGIIGAIDGSHVKIRKPEKEPDVWINRKGSHSINIAAIVDAEKRFLFCSVGCPGSFQDSRVYRISDIDSLMENIPDGFHLVGDSAYSLQTHVLVPYKDNGRLTAAQKSFNYKLSSNRIIVENSFALLKNKFKRIHHKLDVKSWDRAVLVIQCCVYLHNFIINANRILWEPLPNGTTPIQLQPNMEGREKRDYIAARLQ